MRKWAFVFIVLCCKALSAQTISLQPLDTIVPKSYGHPNQYHDVPWAQVVKDRIYYLMYDHRFFVLDTVGKYQYQFITKWPADARDRDFYSLSFQVVDTTIFFVNTHGVLVTDLKGERRHARALGYTLPDSSEIITRFFSKPNVVFSLKNNSIVSVVRLQPLAADSMDEKRMFNPDYYEHTPLFAIYPFKEILKKSVVANPDYYIPPTKAIGKLDKAFLEKKYMPYHADISWQYLEKDNSILYCERATENIKYIGLDGTLKYTFGEKGQHLEPDDIVHAINANDYIQDEQIYHSNAMLYQLINPEYGQVTRDLTTGVTYRNYLTPLAKETLPTNLADGNATFELGGYLQKRKGYLQVYNADNKLIGEISVPTYFNIIGTSNGYIWATIGDNVFSDYKIVHYRVDIK